MNISKNKIAKIEALRRPQADCFAKLLKRFFVLPQSLVNDAQIDDRHLFARIDLRPELIRMTGFLEVASDKVMVMRFDVEPFPFADTRAQLVRFSSVLRR